MDGFFDFGQIHFVNLPYFLYETMYFYEILYLSNIAKVMMTRSHFEYFIQV